MLQRCHELSEMVLSDSGYATVAYDVYNKACTHDAAESLASTEHIGFPVMIKASEGEGKKCTPTVDLAKKFTQAYKTIVGEAPGSPAFVMTLAGAARHLEVQRRHQKILKEAPVMIALWYG
ncbi:hypothetical protein B0H21DRAFT_892191 [Amylocystis lapponica]|nr:hypothetical protein B0H21DRAFT_892191 [Amylocystis lapponica]